MSYIVEILIGCDAPACRKTVRFQRGNRGGLTKTTAGNMAAEQGWQIQRGLTSSADPKLARCPGHRV